MRELPMDPLVQHASRALSLGDPLAALRLVALREDAIGLALRGLAMAQLGELRRARELLLRAVRGFGKRQALARARCVVALAEVAMALRDLDVVKRALPAAIATLEQHRDRDNALHARLVELRRQLLLGRVAATARALRALDLRGASSVHMARAHLIEAELALRSLQSSRARNALDRARAFARRSGVPALSAEVDSVGRVLRVPAGRVIQAGRSRSITLSEVERCLRAHGLLVDACRRTLHCGERRVDLRRRPVLFALVRALAEASPASSPRQHLIAMAFGVSRANDSYRVRLRVELARLRKLLTGIAEIRAVADGFTLIVPDAEPALVLAPPIEGDDAALLALLADGAAWSSSALALALGESQRRTQRALAGLEARGEVRALGRGRAQRWLARPYTDIATILLLPVASSIGYD